MAATAAIVTAAVAVAGTGYTIYSSEQAKAKAEEQAAQAQDQQNKLLDEEKKRTQLQESAAADEAARAKAKNRQMMLSKASLGRKGTIMTSPLGLPGNASTAGGGKTLLGQ